MNPTDPDAIPPGMGIDPALPQPLEPLQPRQPVAGDTGSVDPSGIGNGLVEGVAGIGIDAATELGIDAAIDTAGTVTDAAGSVIEVAGSGCAEGCGGCSLAVLVLLFAVAGSAMALFR